MIKINIHIQILAVFVIILFSPLAIKAQNTLKSTGLEWVAGEKAKLENPITANYIRNHLSKQSPKLILTESIEKNLKLKLNSDPLLQSYFKFLKKESQEILKTPLGDRGELAGHRLAAARIIMGKIGILCMVYRVNKDPEILKHINEALLSICNFPDWNHTHFVDATQIALSVAIAIDWTGEDLPIETVKLAKNALIEKAILPTFEKNARGMGWVQGNKHQTHICHSGILAASLIIADINPELAAKTISRALENIPNSLKELSPNGTHPEGPNFWRFGTLFVALTSDILSSALGKDFGIKKFPGLLESAEFRRQLLAPSGDIFNYGDSDVYTNGETTVLLSWFAANTGDALYLDDSFFENPKDAGRLSGFGLVWLSQFQQQKSSRLPSSWYRSGTNPVAVFRGTENDPTNFYLAIKGGAEQITRVDMDAGSFVFELNDVRWSIDNPDIDTDRFNHGGWFTQDSPRWNLVSKGNQGHSTITVNGSLFNVDGFSPIIDFKEGERPEATVDLSEAVKGQIDNLQRRFVKENNHSILIEDTFDINGSTEYITWQMITVADVEPVTNGVILKQDGKSLRLSILTPENVSVSIISLDPAPLPEDLVQKNMKRLEIKVPAYILRDKKGIIRVRLSAVK